MKLRRRFLIIPHIVFACGLMTGSIHAYPAENPITTEEKIRLMSEALSARDAGDYTAARRNLEQLHAMAPADGTINRLLLEVTQKQSTQPSVEVAIDHEAEMLVREEGDRIRGLLAEVAVQRKRAKAQAREGDYTAAIATLDAATIALPVNPLTQKVAMELAKERASLVTQQQRLVAQTTVSSASLATPAPEPEDETMRLIAKGRAQYLAGEPSAATQTFRTVLARDPENQEAVGYLARMEPIPSDQHRAKTREQLIREVDQSWQRPGVFQEQAIAPDEVTKAAPLVRKLEEIVLPNINFTKVEIGRVVTALSAASEEFDDSGTNPKGVNIVLIDPGAKAPAVTITLRNTNLKRVLDFVTEAVGYQYEVQADAVVVRPGGEATTLDTAFFPVSRATVLRMTGLSSNTAPSGSGQSADPFSSRYSTNDRGPGNGGEAPAMKAFLQQAGVNFDGVSGSSLAYDGAAIIATQTPRNLERIRNILNRYNDIRQVEIEAKFMEVQEGALEELGVNWTVGTKARQRVGGTVGDYATSQRSLAGTFNTNATGQQGAIVRPAVEGVFTDGNANGIFDAGDTLLSSPQEAINLPIINNAPHIPGTAALGAAAQALGTITGVIGEFDVNAVVRALSQKEGTDLLSAPKITVLSGNPATMTVAQELRYPQSFGQTQSQVGTGNSSGGGSAGVAITTGTPQEFTTRNVGVELKVTPTVEEDDYSISLDLNPRVTEFDGFVEYGGPSVAISGNTTVNVPSGFYQPIFSVRDISTKVTIWDGATLIMGGLTREEVKTVNDKVPLLGDIPLLGRLFRSKAESAQKRNLLIFVTANLVSPGGSPKKQAGKNLRPNSLFQNPTIVTPSRAEPRE